MEVKKLIEILRTLPKVGAATAIGVFVSVMISSGPVRAWDDDGEDARVSKGFQIAPVPLNLDRKNKEQKELVGLGSYLVNASGDCNGCHSRDPSKEFTEHGNPYLLGPPNGPFDGHPKINPDTYLAGGRDFGPFPAPGFAHIVSRNLTPDKTGKPVGGDSFSMFLTTIRTGMDPDHLHPNCKGPPAVTCIPPPFNGELLQIMPWPIFRKMTDHDLRAIYEYLSAIPCIKSPHHDC